MRVVLKKNIDLKEVSSEQSYVVYAIYLGSPIEFMIQGQYLEPSFVSSEDVEVIDGRLSKYWTYNKPRIDKPAILSFEEWSSDWASFENLVNSKNRDIWERNRNVMEMEFANPNIPNIAMHVNGNWHECDKCLNIWEPEINSEIVICPECGTTLNKKT